MLFFITLHLTPLKQSLSLNPKLPIITGLVGQQDAEICLSRSTNTGLQVHMAILDFYIDIGHSDPSPPTCTVSILYTEPSLQPLHCSLYEIISTYLGTGRPREDWSLPVPCWKSLDIK